VEEVSNGEECCCLHSHTPRYHFARCHDARDGWLYLLPKAPLVEIAPVLIITGLEDEASVDWAFEVGAIDYVTAYPLASTPPARAAPTLGIETFSTVRASAPSYSSWPA